MQGLAWQCQLDAGLNVPCEHTKCPGIRNTTETGCARYMSERGIWWKTNKSISTGDSSCKDFDETLSNNIDLIGVRKCKHPKDFLSKEVNSIVQGQNNSVDNIY